MSIFKSLVPAALLCAFLAATALPARPATPPVTGVTLDGVVQSIDPRHHAVSIGGLPLLAQGWAPLLRHAPLPPAADIGNLHAGDPVEIRLARRPGQPFQVIALHRR